MNNFFLDSNICIYVFDKSDPAKQQKAFDLLHDFPLISSQVIIESYNACYKKLKLSPYVCEQNILYLCDITRFYTINDTTIRKAVFFKRKYQLSFLDAVIVSSAFFSPATILYSEDMQDGLQIENKLIIINPFI